MRGAWRDLRRGLPVLLVGLAAACQAKSYSPPVDDASTGGGDGGEACTCVLPNAGSTLVVPCGGTACADGTFYACTDVGTALPGTSCGPIDAAADGPVTCVTTCTGKTCNVDDHCGGLCKCAAGVQCNPNGTCGNGCDVALGDVCSADAGTAATCCSTGLACLVRDSGVGTCCAFIGGAPCAQDADCCDYPVARCSTTSRTCG